MGKIRHGKKSVPTAGMDGPAIASFEMWITYGVRSVGISSGSACTGANGGSSLQPKAMRSPVS